MNDGRRDAVRVAHNNWALLCGLMADLRCDRKRFGRSELLLYDRDRTVGPERLIGQRSIERRPGAGQAFLSSTVRWPPTRHRSRQEPVAFVTRSRMDHRFLAGASWWSWRKVRRAVASLPPHRAPADRPPCSVQPNALRRRSVRRARSAQASHASVSRPGRADQIVSGSPWRSN